MLIRLCHPLTSANRLQNIVDLCDTLGSYKPQIDFYFLEFIANNTFCSVYEIMKIQEVHSTTKTGLYKTLIRTFFIHEYETWTLTKRAEVIFDSFERKTLRKTLGPIYVNEQWMIRYNKYFFRISLLKSKIFISQSTNYKFVSTYQFVLKHQNK